MRSPNTVDLEQPPDPKVATPPADTAPADADDRLAALVARMSARAEDFVDRAVRRITGTIGSYDRDATVPRDDLWWSVYRNLQAVLAAVGNERPLDDEELALRREL